MNEFDNNVNNSNELEKKAASEAAQPQANNEETYKTTYTPQGTGNSYNGAYSTYSVSNEGYGRAYNMAPPSPSKEKKSPKAGYIALIACGFIVIAICFSMIGFTIGQTNNILSGIDDPDRMDLIEGSDRETGTVESLSPDTTAPSGEHSATINKTSGGSVKVEQGKVGELMTKAQAAALVKDSVVEITTEQVVKGSSFHQYVQSGAGSGVIIAAEGYVITNNHVISGASKITVRLTNGNEYEAKLIGTDASSDIAVIKISPDEKLTVATLGASSKLSIAEEVIVIGNPLGELGGTVTNGIVSALAREISINGEIMTLIQTNATVNPGNSGGGMFNLYGELVGVVNAKSSGSDVEGLGFAIPIDTAYDIVLQLMDYGYVRGKVDHGLELLDINDLFTAASYRVSSLGVYVLESRYTDEIRNGDRIASINGHEVSTSAGVKEALSGCKVGDTVNVTVVRGGRFYDVTLTLKELVPENTQDVTFE